MSATSSPAFEPNTQLGRSGYVPDTETRLLEAAANLDALMSLVTFELEDGGSFARMNDALQARVLHLVDSLAREVNELANRAHAERHGWAIAPAAGAPVAPAAPAGGDKVEG